MHILLIVLGMELLALGSIDWFLPNSNPIWAIALTIVGLITLALTALICKIEGRCKNENF